MGEYKIEKMMDYMALEIPAKSENESFVRVVVAAFAARLDPTLEEINELKTAVSEAVTNSILHAYEYEMGIIKIKALIEGQQFFVEIHDSGKGIEDIALARETLYTEKPELERSGMGFTIMESFMDQVTIESVPGRGTIIKMLKIFGKEVENNH